MLMFRSTHEQILAVAIADRDAWLAVRERMVAERADAERRYASLAAECAQWKALHDAEHRLVSELLAARADAEKRYEALALQVVELKRAEAGLPPTAFDASLLDPMNSLGPKTQLAIDDFAGGDPEMKKYLVGRAHLEWSALRGQMADLEEIDKEVAEKVRRGDR